MSPLSRQRFLIDLACVGGVLALAAGLGAVWQQPSAFSALHPRPRCPVPRNHPSYNNSAAGLTTLMQPRPGLG